MRRRAAINRVEQSPPKLETSFDTAVAMLEQQLHFLQSSMHQSLASKDLERCCRQLVVLREHYEAVKSLSDAYNALVEELSYQHLPELFADKKQNTAGFPGLGKFTVGHRTSASVLDQEALVKWMNHNGHGDLLSVGIPSQRLSSFVGELLREKGQQIPSHIVKTNIKPYIQVKKP